MEKESKLASHPDHIKVRLYALPIFAMMAFMVSNSFLSFVFQYFSIWVHEFGHALMAWLSGIKATPLSFWVAGLTWVGEEKSSFVFLSFSFLMVLTFYTSKKHRTPFLGYLAISLFFLSIICNFIVPINKNIELIKLAGFAGELILGSLLIISFYYRFPKKWHWEHFFRWPVLFIGFFTLISSTQKWLKVTKLRSLSPFGSNYSEDAVSGVPGDLFALMDEYDWSFKKFIRVYMTLVIVSWVLVLGHYIYFSIIFKPEKIRN